ncbi:hypothetical protein GAMM_200008 [Gammaproteobacteria bacterium]
MPYEKDTIKEAQNDSESRQLLSDTQELAKSLYDEYKATNTTLAEAVKTDNKTAIEQTKQNLSLIYKKIKDEFSRTNATYHIAFDRTFPNKKEIEDAEKDLLYLSDIVFEIDGIKKKSQKQKHPDSVFGFSDFYKADKTAGTSGDDTDTNANTDNSKNRYANNQDNKHDLREQIRIREKEINGLKKKLETAQTEAANNLSELQKIQEAQKVQELQNTQELQNLQNSYNQIQANIDAEKSKKEKCILELANAQKTISSAASAANISAHIRDKLINLALAHLGHTAPENPKSDAFYNTILSLYDFVKKGLLSRHCWKFALAECKLNPLIRQNTNHITSNGYYSYELPDDLLNIQKIIPSCDYEIMGNTLLCRAENARLIFIKCVDDASMPEFFKTLMVYSIAASSAALVTQNEAIARKWEIEANNSFCAAIATDSSQQAIRGVIRNSIYAAHF